MISQVDWSWPTSAELLNVLDIAADPPLLLAVFEAPQPTTATMHAPTGCDRCAYKPQEYFLQHKRVSLQCWKSLPIGLVFVCWGKTQFRTYNCRSINSLNLQDHDGNLHDIPQSCVCVCVDTPNF